MTLGGFACCTTCPGQVQGPVQCLILKYAIEFSLSKLTYIYTQHTGCKLLTQLSDYSQGLCTCAYDGLQPTLWMLLGCDTTISHTLLICTLHLTKHKLGLPPPCLALQLPVTFSHTLSFLQQAPASADCR